MLQIGNYEDYQDYLIRKNVKVWINVLPSHYCNYYMNTFFIIAVQ